MIIIFWHIDMMYVSNFLSAHCVHWSSTLPFIYLLSVAAGRFNWQYRAFVMLGQRPSGQQNLKCSNILALYRTRIQILILINYFIKVIIFIPFRLTNSTCLRQHCGFYIVGLLYPCLPYPFVWVDSSQSSHQSSTQ